MRPFLYVAIALGAALQGCALSTGGAPSAAPTATGAQASRLPERAIRGTIPMTNTIRTAFAAGTRDSSGRPGRNYWQIRTDYTINAKLDVATSRLTGRASIVLSNNSPTAMNAIGFRLDPNIFRPRAYLASPWLPAEVTDGMVITKATVNGEAITINSTATYASAMLATPIAARSKATIEIEWNHKIPGGPGSGHRMVQRWADTLYQPTQWYPRVAVYDDLKGWNADPYLGPAEFFNNFGTWDVSIDVPAGWIVSGTGVLQNRDQVLTPAAIQRLGTVVNSDAEIVIVGPDEVGPGKSTLAGDRLVWRFHADTVNDFAWATAKNFVWKATRANIPTKGYIPIYMYHLPGRAAPFATAGSVTRHALEFYSKLWFPYQWPQFTLQDGPSAGMEYPMVINSNAGAADHETAHQWWPMTVGNNETWYGWMDEGFNQYMNVLSAMDANGRGSLNSAGQSYGNTYGSEAEAPMMWNANFGGTGYSYQTYQKTPPMLSMLGGMFGDSAVQRAHREWGITWMYKHPSPWDYMFFMNNALKSDLGWFWYNWLFVNESVEGSLKSVTTSSAGATVVVHQAGQMPSPVVLRVEFDPSGPAIKMLPNAVMKDSVTATVTFPVDVWFNGRRDFTATLNFGARKINRILLDPGCRFPDKYPQDNSWTPAGGIPAVDLSAPPAGGRGGGGRGGGGAAGGPAPCPGA